MLKKRLIPVLYIKNGLIVRSENFDQHKIIGNVVNEVRRYNQWDIDELIYIDISRDKVYDSRRDDHKIQRVNSIDEVIRLISKECFMPLTFGGGIRDYSTIKKYLNQGADKVSLNTMLHKNPEEVRRAIGDFGAQAVVASVDYRIVDGNLTFYVENGLEDLSCSFDQLINHIIEIGCGEVLLTSMDRDGTGEGYDMGTITKFVDALDIPVIGCGGAMETFDFEELATIEGISGIAAGNMFHFTENAYPRAKKSLKQKGLNFR
jgi:cyclase